MQETTNYHLKKFEANDIIETDSRLAFNDNFDTIDTIVKEASENGGIAVQDTEPTNNVLAWVNSSENGADFCYVGDTEPTNDGSVAIWVDTSADEVPVQAGAGGVTYDNTESGLTSTNVQDALDEELEKINLLYNDYIVEQGTSNSWYYRKWNSGYLEMFYTGQVAVTSSTQIGYTWFSNYFTINYPITPTVMYSKICSCSNANLENVGFNFNASSCQGRIFRSSQALDISNHSISIIITGKWK